MDVVSAPPAGALVALHGAAKRYGRLGPWVLTDVSVRVAAGALTEVRGANGSGKSTLLRLLAGISVPTRGRRDAAPHIGVGYAPERLAPPPPFSADAFLRHHVRLRGLEAQPGMRAAHELAERLAVAGLLAERLSTLSKGSLQKVVLIQSLLGEPRLILLDEPFSGLDAEARGELAQMLGERVSGGAAVVFSDHRSAPQATADVIWHVAQGGVEERRNGDGSAERRSLRVGVRASDGELARLLADGWHIVSVAADGGAEVRIEARRAGPG